MVTEQELKDFKAACDAHRKEISEKLSAGSQKFTEVFGRLGQLEARHGEFLAALADINRDLKKMVQTLTELRLDIAAGRPSWAIMIIITTLFSASVGLITYVITKF